MKQRKSSPHTDELREKTKGVTPIISLEDNNVKLALESAMTLYFKSLEKVIELQRKARVVSDG
jgi:hypothetical protein